MASSNTEKVADDLAKQIDEIRDQINEIKKIVGSAGASSAAQIKAQAKEKLSQFSDITEEELRVLREKADDAGERIISGVRQQPLAAVGIAAGVGFLLALMLRNGK